MFYMLTQARLRFADTSEETSKRAMDKQKKLKGKLYQKLHEKHLGEIRSMTFYNLLHGLLYF